MHRILISGYHGFNNAGDEAILESILQVLGRAASRQGASLEVTVLSADPEKTRQTNGVHAVSRTSLPAILGAVRRCDLFVSGGGSLLQDKTGKGLSVFYYLGLVFLARLFGKPTVLYAHGIGPINKKVNRLIARWIINGVDLVTVRDDESRRELEALGVRRPPVHVTVDPAFFLKPERGDGGAKVQVLLERARPSSGGPLVGISVREWTGQERFLPEIARAADLLSRELGAGILFVPLFPGQDLEVSRRTAAMMETPAQVVEEELSSREMLDLFNHLDLLIGVRLHSLIFAALVGTPLVGVGYDPKVSSFLARLGFDAAGRVEQLTAEELCQAALQTWQGREGVQQRLRHTVEEFSGEAVHCGEMIYSYFFGDEAWKKDDRPAAPAAAGEEGAPPRESPPGAFYGPNPSFPAKGGGVAEKEPAPKGDSAPAAKTGTAFPGKRPLKVLHLISGGDTGGAKTHVLSLLKELQKTMPAALVCLMEGDFYREGRAMGLDIRTVPQRRRYDLAAVRRLRRLIQEEGFDILHCHGARANFLAVFLRRSLKIPTLTTMHSDYRLDFQGSFYKNLVYTTLNSLALRTFDYYIAVSDNFRDMLIERGFPPERIFVVYNGIDLEVPLELEDREQLLPRLGAEGVPPDAPLVGTLGRLHPVKGHDIFLKGARRILEEEPGVHFLIGGEGESWQSLLQQRDSMGLQENVHIVGYIYQSDRFINILDINTLTSYSESFPLVLLEGARLKKPTVSSDVGGISRLVRDGETGLLFPAGDDRAFAEKVLALLRDREKAGRLGENLYRCARDHFSLQRLGEAHLEIYQKVLGEVEE